MARSKIWVALPVLPTLSPTSYLTLRASTPVGELLQAMYNAWEREEHRVGRVPFFGIDKALSKSVSIADHHE